MTIIIIFNNENDNTMKTILDKFDYFFIVYYL